MISELCQPESETFSDPDPIIINGDEQGPATPYPSVINVQGLEGAIRDVTVTLYDFSHEFPADVDILLVGPDGQNVILMSDAGGGVSVTNIDLTFDDQAQNALPSSGPLVSGIYRPTNYFSGDNFPPPAPPGSYGSTLSVFNGSDPNGAWNLYVFDDAKGDRGAINSGWDLSITTNPCVSTSAPGGEQVNGVDLDDAIFALEAELLRAFQVILDAADPDQVERFLKLLINKELLLLMIRDEIVHNGNGNGNGEECPCKFRLGTQGNGSQATVTVTQTGQEPQTLGGMINVTAVQCFTGARHCNPNVDNFNIEFRSGQGPGSTTINFTQGRRIAIACEDRTVAQLQGTAQATGNLLSGNFTVDLTFTINPDNTGTWVINATSTDNNTTFSTTFTAPLSPRTFIGACTDSVGGS